MKVKAIWEFDVDVSDLDPKFVDVPDFAIDCAKRELGYLLENGEISADDFDFVVSEEDKK